MGSRKSSLRAESVGVHPRVYVTDKEIEELGLREHPKLKLEL